jgi:hypothetical protein
MRRWLVWGIVLVASLLTSGCTVPLHAVAGIGVDADGRLVGYLSVCGHHHIDGAKLYHGGDSIDASWTAPQQVTDFTFWTLASPSHGWRADPPLTHLRPATEYTLYGGTSDNSSSAQVVTFTVEQLARLKPDQVMHWSGTDKGVDVMKIDSVEEYRRNACQVLR